MKNIIWLILLSVVVVAGCKGASDSESQTISSVSSGNVKEFDAAISGYEYDPPSIRVNFGDQVKVNIKNNDGIRHGISLPGFGVQEFVGPGETTTIQFVANQRGSPETFCSTDHGEKLLINIV